MKIAILDYAAGNKRSVLNAVRKIGYDAMVTSKISELQSVDKIIFPGVGQAKFAMQSLHALKLDRFLAMNTKPLLGICLGMQLMGQFHKEGNVQGLGLVDVDIHPFETALKVPHLGWNQVQRLENNEHSPLFNGIQSDAYFYFIHSYYMPVNAYTIASCQYDHSFTAAIQYKHNYATQFHPEKSGEPGLELLKNFIEKC